MISLLLAPRPRTAVESNDGNWCNEVSPGSNPTKRHIVTSQVEHSSVLNFCKALEKETGSTTPAQRATPPQLRRGAFTNSPPDSGGAGALATGVVTGGPYRVTYLPVDREGLLFFLV